jgi:hypothetical protein
MFSAITHTAAHIDLTVWIADTSTVAAESARAGWVAGLGEPPVFSDTANSVCRAPRASSDCFSAPVPAADEAYNILKNIRI